MASKVENPNVTAAALVAAVFCLNWLSARYYGFPFVWCWGKQYLQPLLEPWFLVIQFMALAWFAMAAWSGSVINTLKAILIIILVYGLPKFADESIRLGKSCF